MTPDEEFNTTTFGEPAPEKRDVLMVAFTGAPGAGKDTQEDALQALLEQLGLAVYRMQQKDALWDRTADYFGVERWWFKELATDRTTKEAEHPSLIAYDRMHSERDEMIYERMHSPRSAMIYVSEEIMKPLYGKDVFSQCAWDDVPEDVDVIITEFGFYEEANFFRGRAKEVHYVQLLDRDTNFKGDSRELIIGPCNNIPVIVDRSVGGRVKNATHIFESLVSTSPRLAYLEDLL